MIWIESYLGSINVQNGSNFILVSKYVGVIKNPRHINRVIELTIDNKLYYQ